MGKSCCENKSTELAALREKQAGVLKAVLIINAVMFAIELTAGILARSTALVADSLDMLGDASVYAFSLYALHKGAQWRTRAGYAKGVVMALFGTAVLGQAIYRFMLQTTPEAFTMGVVAAVALAANLFCLFLLYSHRSDDINMRSTWLCSRNDIVANTGVIAASWFVAVLHSGIPDLLIGSVIAGLFLWSSKSVISEARRELSRLRREVTQLSNIADIGD
jgi:Co/Zn/Cd efflux system component